MDRHETEAELHERLGDAFAELARLTHKINNPLTSLLGRAQLLRMAGGADERTLRAAQVIEESATRVADYVAELAEVVLQAREALAEKSPCVQQAEDVRETVAS